MKTLLVPSYLSNIHGPQEPDICPNLERVKLKIEILGGATEGL